MNKMISTLLLLSVAACSMFEPNKRLNPLDSKNPLAASGGTLSIAPGSSKSEIILNWSGVTASNLEGWYVYASTSTNMPSSYSVSVDKAALTGTLTGISPYTTNWNFWLQPYSNSYTGTAVKSRFDLGGAVHATTGGHPSGGNKCLRFENIPLSFSRSAKFAIPVTTGPASNDQVRLFVSGSGLGSGNGDLILMARTYHVESNTFAQTAINVPSGSYGYVLITNTYSSGSYGNYIQFAAAGNTVEVVFTLSNAKDSDGSNSFLVDVWQLAAGGAAPPSQCSNDLEAVTFNGDLRP